MNERNTYLDLDANGNICEYDLDTNEEVGVYQMREDAECGYRAFKERFEPRPKRPDYYLEYLDARIEFCSLNLNHNPTLTSDDRKRFEEHRLDAMQKRAEYLAAKRKECHE